MTASTNDSIAALRALAELHPEVVHLFPGFSDAELDAFPVPVPERERSLLREIGGFLFAGAYFGPGCEGREPGEPAYLTGDVIGGDWDTGPAGSSMQVHMRGGSCDRYYVDVDRDTGHWGPILGASSDFMEVLALQARSLGEWWSALAAGIGAMLTEYPGREDWQDDPTLMLDTATSHLAGALDPWDNRYAATAALPVRELIAELSATEREHFAGLSDGALAIDLNALEPPRVLDVRLGEESERRCNGRFLIVPAPLR